jgi:zinc protease
MDRVIKRLGGRNNAGTSMEWTHYYATVPGESVGVAIDVIADGILHPALDPAEIERERKVVVEEILRKEDTPAAKVYVLYQQALAPGLPYARPVLGTRESLEGIDRDVFRGYISAHYVPRNMVVVVTGDVEARDVLDRIGACFGGAPDVPPPAPPEFELPPLEEPRIVREEKDAKQAYFMMGYPTRGRRDRDDMAALEVAAAILAGGRSSRLYRALVEEGHLLTSVSAWHHAMRNGGALVVEGAGDPGTSEEARAAIRAELRRLAGALPEEGEIVRAKGILESGWILDAETTAARAGVLGRWELMFGAEKALEYESEIEGVSAADVQRVVRKYVRSDAYVMGLITPSSKGAGQ